RPLSSIDGLAAPEKNSYNKAQIDELVNEIYRVISTSDDFNSKRLDDIYYLFDNNINGVYYPLRDDVDFLTTRLDALQHEMVIIQRQLDSQAEPSPSIDRRTRPSIDRNYTTGRSKRVIENSLQDKLDEITFSQDLLKE
ncbi:hypothetical protein HID58_018639, partial [Brassica napus]